MEAVSPLAARMPPLTRDTQEHKTGYPPGQTSGDLTGSGQRDHLSDMTVLENVSALVTRLSPAPMCDACIAERLGLSVSQQANHKTRELAGAAASNVVEISARCASRKRS